MPFQRVPHTCEILVRGTQQGQEIINTFYGQFPSAYALADLEALASALDMWANSVWKPLLCPEYGYAGITVRGLDAPIDLEVENNTHAGPGTHAGDALPNNVSLAIKRTSGFTGRGARGRIFMPSIPTPDLETGDVVSASFAAAVLAGLDAMDTAITEQGFVPVIVHRVASGVPLAEAVVFTLVEWVVVDLVIDSMRRRLPGRGV